MFNIRLAEKDDIKAVFELSNDDEVRKNSINTGKIQWEDHVKWFENRIKNIDEPFFIAENETGDFVAQIRFNKEEEGTVISVSIEKNFRGKGFGALIIKEACEKLGKTPVIAYIKPENAASEKSFIKAGFKPCPNNEALKKYIFNG